MKMKKCLLALLPFALLATNTYATNSPLEELSGHDIIGDEFWRNGNQQALDKALAVGSNIKLDNLTSSSVEKAIKDSEVNKINEVRRQTLETAALSFGSQSGLARGSYVVNSYFEDYNKKHDRKLDKEYNFDRVLLEKGFLPPVISESINAYQRATENEVRAADKIFKIEFPARIVSATPDWRSYLIVDAVNPEMPSRAVLPKTSAEKALWDDWVKKGWSQGIEQAGDLAENGISRLARDYNGMLRYKIMYEQNMVDKPKLSRTDLGVTGGGSEMAVGDRVIKKVKDANLNPKSSKWFK